MRNNRVQSSKSKVQSAAGGPWFRLLSGSRRKVQGVILGIMRLFPVLAVMLIAAGMLFPQQENGNNSWHDLTGIVTEKKDKDILTLRFKLTGPSRFNTFRLQNPSRLVVEIENAAALAKKDIVLDHVLVKKVRSGQYKDKPMRITRVVMDLAEDAAYRAHASENDILLELVSIKPQAAVKQPEPKAVSAPPAEKPAAPAPDAPREAPAQESISLPADYTVVSGDTLSKISRKFYGRPDYWRNILQANGETLENQYNLKVGMKIKIPALGDMAKAPPAAAARPVVKTEPLEKKEEGVKKEEAVKPAPAKPRPPAKKEKPAAQKKIELSAEDKYTVPDKQKEQIEKIREKEKAKPASITLDFTDADIRDILNVLADEMNINIIWEDGVSGEVSIHLKEVPFEDALESVLTQKGFSHEVINPSTIRVLSKATSVTQIIPINYSTPGEIKGLIAGILSPGAKVQEDTRLNSLIITDTADNINRAKKMIMILDQKPKQVMIEAKIIEVAIDKNTDLGINWQFAGNMAGSMSDAANPNAALDTSVGLGGMVPGKVQGSEVAGTVFQPSVGGLPPTIPGFGTAWPSAANFTIGVVMNKAMLNMTLSALQSTGRTKILSNPRIATLNNKAASIMIGDQIPYLAGGTVGSVSTSQTAFLAVGIKLSVKPTINQDDRILLEVSPEVSSPKIFGGAYGTKTRTAQTNVLVRDGDTIVIGGLISENEATEAQQLPLLGDLPILGYLFKRKGDTYSRSELLIFITPTLIRE